MPRLRLPLPLPRVWRRFARAKRGSAAVEFALVAVPFFLLTFGMAEVSMLGFVQTSLDFAVSETGRLIRTGQAQSGGMGAAEIEGILCQEVTKYAALDCDSNLFLDVDRFDSFVDVVNDSPIQDGTFQPGGFGYSPGQASDIVVVRAYYRWQVMTPLFQSVFSNVEGGERIVVSTAMFRNEPF